MKHKTLFIYTFRLFIEGMRNAFNEKLIRMNLEQISQYGVAYGRIAPFQNVKSYTFSNL